MKINEHNSENVLEIFLCFDFLDAKLCEFEVGSREHVASLRVHPAEPRHLHQTVAKQKNQQEQTPSVTRRYCKHLQFGPVTNAQKPLSIEISFGFNLP